MALHQSTFKASSCRHCALRSSTWTVSARKQSSRRRMPVCQVLDMCTVVAVASNLDSGLYDVGQTMNALVQGQLTELSPATCGVVLLAGLLTSVSPCTLSVLPLTIGYIGGYADSYDSSSSSSNNNSSTTSKDSSSESGGGCCSAPSSQTSSSSSSSITAEGETNLQSSTATAGHFTTIRSRSTATTSSSSSQPGGSRLGVQALCFSLGLASTLAGLGVASSLLGRAYGQIGSELPTAVAVVAVLMGLNLLQVVSLPLPSVDVDVRAARLPPPLTAYLAGATFALAASPCSTPVLASLLAYVSTSGNPAAGGVLLLFYSCGYVTPLLVAATATGAAKQVLAMREMSSWVTPASGVLLVTGGTYALLTRLLPAV